MKRRPLSRPGQYQLGEVIPGDTLAAITKHRAIMEANTRPGPREIPDAAEIAKHRVKHVGEWREKRK